MLLVKHLENTRKKEGAAAPWALHLNPPMMTTYRIQKFCFQVSSLIMSLNDKFASFFTVGVAYRKDFPTNAGSADIINWPVIAKFDSITKLPFIHVEARFS